MGDSYKIVGTAAGDATREGPWAAMIVNEKSGAQNRLSWRPLEGAILPRRGDAIEAIGISGRGIHTVKCNGRLISAPSS
jgi:uncharacterized membrane protein